MKRMRAWLFSAGMIVLWAPHTLAEQAVKRNPINVVAVGYDIEKNAKAKQMLQEMVQAARDAGAVGEVILSGQDQAELERAMERAMSIATKPPAEPDRKPGPHDEGGWQSIRQGAAPSPGQEGGVSDRQRKRTTPPSTPSGF